jgi:hypothetical protein
VTHTKREPSNEDLTRFFLATFENLSGLAQA